MEELPLLVLETVCEYLACAEPRRNSLLAFASTSKTCRWAARRELFSRVFLRTSSDEQLKEELERVEHLLDVTKSKKLVRVLKVGYTIGDGGSSDDNDGLEDDTCMDDESDDGSDDPFSTFPTRDVRFIGPRGVTAWAPKKESRPDEAWEPVARFASGLALKDLIWASTEQVPRCIISILHEQLRKCRLHVHCFDLRSVHHKGELKDIEDTDYLLATSPSLCSIIAPYSSWDWCTNHNEEAVWHMVKGLAPNLKHVRMWDNSPRSYGELGAPQRPARLPWRGFYPISERLIRDISMNKGKIESLRIDPFGSGPDLSQLSVLGAYADLSHLRYLKLTWEVTPAKLRILSDLAERGAFRDLRALDLTSRSYTGNMENDRAMEQLLLHLPTLEHLSMEEIGNASFQAALRRHGTTLQSLHITEFVLSSQQVHLLRASCSNMRDLRIEVPRTASSSVEVRMYHTLGSMRNLERLDLNLQCIRRPEGEADILENSWWRPSDEGEEEKQAPIIREIFINAALDEDLARSIFEEMLAAQAEVWRDLPPKLSLIRLRMAKCRDSPGDFAGIVRWLGRIWVCRRDTRDTHCRDFTVTEMGQGERKKIGKDFEVDDLDDLPWSCDEWLVVWRSLWGETGPGWLDNWRSVPLDRRTL